MSSPENPTTITRDRYRLVKLLGLCCIFSLVVPLLSLFFSGCSDYTRNSHSAVPIPVSPNLPFKYEARLWKYYGGDSFETVDGINIHFVMVEGISTPGWDQPFHKESQRKAYEHIRRKKIEVEVVSYDPLKREVAHIYAKDENGVRKNLAELLLKSGLAWFDHSEGEYSQRYLELETEAKLSKIGIWSQKNPIPPWEVWKSKVELLNGLSE